MNYYEQLKIKLESKAQMAQLVLLSEDKIKLESERIKDLYKISDKHFIRLCCCVALLQDVEFKRRDNGL